MYELVSLVQLKEWVYRSVLRQQMCIAEPILVKESIDFLRHILYKNSELQILYTYVGLHVVCIYMYM